MRRLALLALFALLAALAPASGAAQPAPAQKPYQPVAVKLPPALADESLAAFRKELAAVAERRIYAELARLVISHGFFWERDFDRRFDARKPPVDNLAAAIRLEHLSGAGWAALAAFAAEPSAAELPGRLGVFCAPAPPDYDVTDLDRVIDTIRSNAMDWAYPRADKTPVRAAAQPQAATVETLGLHFVRVLGSTAEGNDPDVKRAAWTRVATPSGKAGFVAPGALLSLAAPRLCYGKDAFGRWRIVGFVTGD